MDDFTPLRLFFSLGSYSSLFKIDRTTSVDFRDQAKFDKGHIEGAKHVNYSDMFSHPMMEQLNKSNSLIIVHDVPAVAGVIASTLKMMDYPNVYILK